MIHVLFKCSSTRIRTNYKRRKLYREGHERRSCPGFLLVSFWSGSWFSCSLYTVCILFVYSMEYINSIQGPTWERTFPQREQNETKRKPGLPPIGLAACLERP